MAIGETLGGQVTKSSAEAVVAPGASCRTQLADLAVDTDGAFAGVDRDEPPTPIEALDAAIDDGER
jgi:Fe-S oxidoreductase